MTSTASYPVVASSGLGGFLKQILSDRRDGLEAASDALIVRETLTGEELSNIAAEACRRKPIGTTAA